MISYLRVTRSLVLIIINAVPIAATTKPPANKLDIKFPNDAVIFNSLQLFLIILIILKYKNYGLFNFRMIFLITIIFQI
jgi:hypothetical protein